MEARRPTVDCSTRSRSESKVSGSATRTGGCDGHKYEKKPQQSDYHTRGYTRNPAERRRRQFGLQSRRDSAVEELASGTTTGSKIVLAESDDLVRWRTLGPVMAGRPHYLDELIGSGPPI
jgi:hypothetical protein